MHQNNIKPILLQKFGKVRESRGKNGLEYIVDCPFCSGKRKLYINPLRELYICFKCGETGGVGDLVGRSNFGRQPPPPPPAPLPAHIQEPGELVELTTLEEDSAPRLYLQQRGFDHKELSDSFGVRYCVDGRRFAGGLFDTTNTLIFPFWMDDQIAGWQARLLYDPDSVADDQCKAMGFIQDEDRDWVRPPKYWTAPGVQKGRIFFNYDWAKQSEVVVVCEGPFDAIAVGRCAVATLGKGISEQQAKRIKLMPEWKLVVILLDPGDADAEAAQLLGNLHRTVPVVRIDLEGYKDAGEAPREEIWKQIYATAQAQDINLLDYRLVI